MEAVEELIAEIFKEEEALRKEENRFTISEVVELLRREGFNVEAHKLRDYEKKELLKPTRVESSEQRRYNGADIRQLRRILLFLFVGFSLKKIKKMYEAEKELFDSVQQYRERRDNSIESKELQNRGTRMHLAALRLNDFYDEVKERIQNLRNILNTAKDTSHEKGRSPVLIFEWFIAYAQQEYKKKVGMY